MIAIAFLFVCLLCDCFKSRRRLEAEILVLRHQLNVLQQRAPRRLHLRWADRPLFMCLYRRCPRILDAITIVRPETIVRWHRMGFAAYWRWKSRPLGGRPRIAPIIMKCEVMFRWGRTHPAHARSSGLEILSRIQSLAGCTESSFQKRQDPGSNHTTRAGA